MLRKMGIASTPQQRLAAPAVEEQLSQSGVTEERLIFGAAGLVQSAFEAWNRSQALFGFMSAGCVSLR